MAPGAVLNQQMGNGSIIVKDEMDLFIADCDKFAKVLDEKIDMFNWGLVEDGIYYFDFRSKIMNFKFFYFTTQTTKTIATLEIEGECAYPQISQDRQWLYFMYEEPWQADIKLVENWR